jgi:methylmalonyl-CoA mutase
VKQKKLFEQFPPVSTKEWIDKINADLNGAEFNQKMVWKTGEGFDVMPFYRRDDLKRLKFTDAFLPLILREDFTASGRDKVTKIATGSWLVRQNITVTDYREANRKALSLLMKGIDSLGFIIEDPETINEKNFSVLLDGIVPEGSEINFFSNGKASEIISLLILISEKREIKMSAFRGAVEADPIGRLMLNGTLCIPVAEGFDYLAQLTRETQCLPHFRNIQVNGSTFTNAGAGTVKELAFSLSMAADYLDQLSERGISADDVASKIRFSFGTGSDYFMEIAKLRAARLLWSYIADAYDPSYKEAFRMEIHSVTKVWNDAVDDPYINMLRTQTEAMSAILGGTDSLTVNPYDISDKTPDEFSERIARNQQLILREEAWFDKVTDPSAGSYYIENLTALIAENSWKLFLEIESKGGFLSVINSGYMEEQFKEFATSVKK